MSPAGQHTAPAKLWNRDYLLLLQGQVVSQVGDAFYMLAVFWFVYRKTGSPLATGTVMTCMVLPYVFLGPLAGRVIDRVNKRQVLVGADLARGLIVGGVTLLAWLGRLEVWQIYAAVGLAACCTVFFNPAVTASIPCLVPPQDMIRANSLGGMASNLAAVVSPLVGGVAIAVVGVELAFFINAMSYILSAASEMFISPAPLAPSQAQKAGSRQGLKETIASLRAQPTLFRLICASLVVNFFGMAVILLPIFAVGRLGGSSVDLGVISSSYAAGALVAILVLSARGPRLNQGRLIPPLLAVFGLGFLVLGLHLDLATAIGVMVVLGLCATTTRMCYVTLMQRRIDRRMHGRAFGVIMAADTGLQPATYLVTGALVEAISLETTLVVFGLCVLAGAAYLFRLPGLAELAPPAGEEQSGGSR
jgi:MFS family permease